MKTEDIAGKSHWDNVYASSTAGWRPAAYAELCLEHMLLEQIKRGRPTKILEVGCGNSTWLPHLGRVTGCEVAGIDYSEQGCELARKNLALSGVNGLIICGDIFKLDSQQTGTFDLVYSLGLIEHFEDPGMVTAKLLEFVSPGGILLTEVPNFASVHGLLVYLYQPDLFKKHKVLTLKQLRSMYKTCRLKNVQSSLLGVFSPGIVAWGIEQRFPKLDILLLPFIRLFCRVVDAGLSRLRSYAGLPLFAPFLYVAGTKAVSEAEMEKGE